LPAGPANTPFMLVLSFLHQSKPGIKKKECNSLFRSVNAYSDQAPYNNMTGQVYKYYLQDWEDPIIGQVVLENDDWILVQYIPTDYFIDGYKIIKRSVIVKTERTPTEEQVERVISLRGITAKKPEQFRFGTILELINWIERKYKVFEFQDADEDTRFIGKINQVLEDEYLLIDFIDANGRMDEAYDYEFELAEIRTLTFDTDYFNAIKLLWQDNRKETDNLGS
jgi:hypothetical protein